jgi:hypothetical protein
MNILADRIKNCTSQSELDALRIEIVRDEDNIIENQKLFIKKIKSLRNQGKYHSADMHI